DAEEFGRGDADDGEDGAIEAERAADGGGVHAEAAAPIGVADDGDGRGVEVGVRVEEAAEGGDDAEDGVVGAGDELGVDGFRLGRVEDVTAVDGGLGEDAV